MGRLVDSAEAPRVRLIWRTDKFWLEVETGTRRGGGKHIEVDWTLERDKSDPDVIMWAGVDWDTRPATAKSAGGQADDTVAAILQVVADHPNELTETGVLEKVGGNRAKARETFLGLKANGGVVVKNRGAKGGHTHGETRPSRAWTERRKATAATDTGPRTTAGRKRCGFGGNRYRRRYGFGTGCPMNGRKYLLGTGFQPVPVRGTGCPLRRPRRAGYGQPNPYPPPPIGTGCGCPPWSKIENTHGPELKTPPPIGNQ